MYLFKESKSEESSEFYYVSSHDQKSLAGNARNIGSARVPTKEERERMVSVTLLDKAPEVVCGDVNAFAIVAAAAEFVEEVRDGPSIFAEVSADKGTLVIESVTRKKREWWEAVRKFVGKIGTSGSMTVATVPEGITFNGLAWIKNSRVAAKENGLYVEIIFEVFSEEKMSTSGFRASFPVYVFSEEDDKIMEENEEDMSDDGDEARTPAEPEMRRKCELCGMETIGKCIPCLDTSYLLLKLEEETESAKEELALERAAEVKLLVRKARKSCSLKEMDTEDEASLNALNFFNKQMGIANNVKTLTGPDMPYSGYLKAGFKHADIWARRHEVGVVYGWSFYESNGRVLAEPRALGRLDGKVFSMRVGDGAVCDRLRFLEDEKVGSIIQETSNISFYKTIKR